MLKTRRICLELNEEEVNNLNQMKESVGVRTYRELLNNALTLLEWAIAKCKSGRIIASVDEKKNKYQEMVLPILTFPVKNIFILKCTCGFELRGNAFSKTISNDWKYCPSCGTNLECQK